MVRDPSTLVVMENVIPLDSGPVQSVETRYNFAGAGGYAPTGFKFDPILLRSKLPLDFFQARNAVPHRAGIGRRAACGGDLRKRRQSTGAGGKTGWAKKIDKRALSAASREAVQTAEDARAIAAPQVQALRVEDERKAARGA